MQSLIINIGQARTVNLCKTFTLKKTKHWFSRPIRALFGLFLSGRFTQALLYFIFSKYSYLDKTGLR